MAHNLRLLLDAILLQLPAGLQAIIIAAKRMAFQWQKDILHLMERSARADGVQIFVGEEAGFGPLVDFSLVAAPYQNAGRTIGVIGVIGPTRMAYDRVIPVVDVTARMLSAALRGAG